MSDLDFKLSDPRQNEEILLQVLGLTEFLKETERRKSGPVEGYGLIDVSDIETKKDPDVEAAEGKLIRYLLSLNMNQVRAVACAYCMMEDYRSPRICDESDEDYDSDENDEDDEVYPSLEAWIDSVVTDFLKTSNGYGGWKDNLDELMPLINKRNFCGQLRAAMANMFGGHYAL